MAIDERPTSDAEPHTTWRPLWLVFIGVAGLAVTAVLTFGWGVVKTYDFARVLFEDGASSQNAIIIVLEIIDLFLLATVVAILAIGLFELFIFDALPMADRWVAMETSREEEFAPLKNATGADSPASVKRAISRLHASWFERAGVAVPRTPEGEPENPLEISPLFALDAEECQSKVSPDSRISGPAYVK